jgi:small subunit ribosomal protein S1
LVFHDDFDWSRDKRNVVSYTADEKAKYDSVYDNTFKQINDGEMIQATVESLTKTDAVVNIGFKSDGLISLNEFRDIPGGVKVGDVIEVMVVEKEDREGNLNLSRKSGTYYTCMGKNCRSNKTGEIVTGLVTSKPKVV